MSQTTLVICPVYNEEKTLGRFHSQLRELYNGDLLYIDDGSKDRGRVFLEKLEETKTFVIRHAKRLGYGRSLIDGIRFSLENEYHKVVTIDADLQHDPSLLDLFFYKLNYRDVVLGTRYVRLNTCYDVPLKRMIINRYIMNLFRVLFNFSITDPFCGYRGYTRSFLLKAGLQEESYGFGLDVLMEMIKNRVSYAELSVELKYLDISRRFYGSMNNSKKRLLHYLEVIERKRRELASDAQGHRKEILTVEVFPEQA